MDQSIKVMIRDSQKIVLEEQVFALSSKNKKGVFDVLPEHANFICLCEEFLMLHKLNGEKRQITISGGLLKVSRNSVSVYLGIVPTEFSEEEILREQTQTATPAKQVLPQD